MDVAIGFPWSIILESAQLQYLLTSESVALSCLSITLFMQLATHAFIPVWVYASEGSICIPASRDKPTKILNLSVIIKGPKQV